MAAQKEADRGGEKLIHVMHHCEWDLKLWNLLFISGLART